jgi:hypothetical protein
MWQRARQTFHISRESGASAFCSFEIVFGTGGKLRRIRFESSKHHEPIGGGGDVSDRIKRGSIPEPSELEDEPIVVQCKDVSVSPPES